MKGFVVLFCYINFAKVEYASVNTLNPYGHGVICKCNFL